MSDGAEHPPPPDKPGPTGRSRGHRSRAGARRQAEPRKPLTRRRAAVGRSATTETTARPRWPAAAGRTAARPVPPVLLAQPDPRPVADLGPRPGAAGRHPGDVRDRPAVLRRLQPRPQPDQRHDARQGTGSASTCSPGPPTRSGSTGSTRACTSPWGWCSSRSCWPSCGRCCRSCSSGRRCAPPRTRWSGCRCSCSSAAAVFEFVTGILNIQRGTCSPAPSTRCTSTAPGSSSPPSSSTWPSSCPP